MRVFSFFNFKKCFIFKAFRLFIYIYLQLKKKINKLKVQLLWRDRNRHNFTRVLQNSDSDFPIEKVKVGNHTYGPLCVISYGSPDEFLEIGSFCSIANGVKFILGGEHNLKKLSTYPFKRIFLNNNEVETYSKGRIILEDDVWIGTDVIILSGVKLARGTVVAAGSVVVKSSEPFSIIGGNPAKLIRKRFSDEVISQLLNTDYDMFTKKYIAENIEIIDKEIDVLN